MSGNKMYEATIQTGNDEHGVHYSVFYQQAIYEVNLVLQTAGTTGAIELTMSGTYRQASPKMLLEGVKPGAEERVAFRAADDTLEIVVGEIESLLLHNSAVEDPWFCESVRISTDSGSVTSFTVKRWIGSPFQAAVTVTLRPSLDTDMSPQDIQCHTRGTDLVSMATKHMEIFKVRCPMNCAGADFALSEGASIHPGTSAVCAAAELDGVASASGGVLVVTVVGALPEYSPTEPLKSGTGYLHGMYHEDGCSNLYGHNVCAGPRYPIAAAGPEKSIHDCTFEEPTPQCRNHSFDVAVKCSNNPPAEPIFGALRIVDEEGSPVMDGTGRLQVYKTGWGSICDDGWTKESERVSCLQMGYIGIKMCKAAIHAGAIGKNGGEIAVILGHGQRSYWGSSRNGIPSESAEAQSTSGLQQRLQQVEQQTALVLIPPKFQWGAPQDFAVDESGEIVLEHNCSPHTISTGVTPAIDAHAWGGEEDAGWSRLFLGLFTRRAILRRRGNVASSHQPLHQPDMYRHRVASRIQWIYGF
ncbi:hypothetical protein Emag_005613 [Eimeria magna]